jgi:hypothetical protein
MPSEVLRAALRTTARDARSGFVFALFILKAIAFEIPRSALNPPGDEATILEHSTRIRIATPDALAYRCSHA